MNVGKTIGYLLLSLVDALCPPVVIIALGLMLVPAELIEEAAPYLLGLGAITFVAALIVAFVSVRRGGKPFPVTRGTKRVFGWAMTWLP